MSKLKKILSDYGIFKPMIVSNVDYYTEIYSQWNAIEPQKQYDILSALEHYNKILFFVKLLYILPIIFYSIMLIAIYNEFGANGIIPYFLFLFLLTSPLAMIYSFGVVAMKDNVGLEKERMQGYKIEIINNIIKELN